MEQPHRYVSQEAYDALRAENEALREALGAAWGLIEGIQADGEKYLIPDNGCNQDWFVNRTLWHTDGPAQREAAQKRQQALGSHDAETKP